MWFVESRPLTSAGTTSVVVKAQIPQPLPSDSVAAREAALIARVVAGERELFHELVRPYEKAVYFAAFSVLRNPQDAEDTAQETMLKALKNLHQFRADSKFSTWLLLIWLLQQAPIGSVEGCPDRRFRRRYANFKPTSPAKRPASSTWRLVAGPMVSSVLDADIG